MGWRSVSSANTTQARGVNTSTSTSVPTHGSLRQVVVQELEVTRGSVPKPHDEHRIPGEKCIDG